MCATTHPNTSKPRSPCVTEWQDHRKPRDKASESWDTKLPKRWERIGINVPHPHLNLSNPFSTSTLSKYKSYPSQFCLNPLCPSCAHVHDPTPSASSSLILEPSPCLRSCLIVLCSVSQASPLSPLPQGLCS